MFSPAIVLACLLEEFGLPILHAFLGKRAREKMASSFVSILRDGQCGSIEVVDEEGISAESEEKYPTWLVEEDDKGNTSQLRGPFRFGEVEVSKEKVIFANLYC
ncbi:unnamed protein product [Heligmosomoides polygyrus]|uniref:Uncharacterized protein n=1 Tax=Heligmosomoides polygyrus TaxID=6339 RepID=A0A183GKQ6_HELPZ|nr:unnamed protein product [Heligmosomoides polygyrus]